MVVVWEKRSMTRTIVDGDFGVCRWRLSAQQFEVRWNRHQGYGALLQTTTAPLTPIAIRHPLDQPKSGKYCYNRIFVLLIRNLEWKPDDVAHCQRTVMNMHTLTSHEGWWSEVARITKDRWLRTNRRSPTFVVVRLKTSLRWLPVAWHLVSTTTNLQAEATLVAGSDIGDRRSAHPTTPIPNIPSSANAESYSSVNLSPLTRRLVVDCVPKAQASRGRV